MKLRHLLLLCLSVLQAFILKAQCPPPDNDHYSDAFLLTINNNGIVATTCCASGYNDDNASDLPNTECGSEFQHNSVWFKYVTGQEDWIAATMFVLGGNEFDENMSLEIYSGTNTTPSSNLFNSSSYNCGTNYRPLNLGCYSPGETIWFKVSNKDGFCNNFSISLTPSYQGNCAADDDCVNVSSIITFAPVDINCGPASTTEVAGCLAFGCPETIINTCGADVNPTIWFEVEVDTYATQLFTYINTSGSWKPNLAIYKGTCDNLTLVDSGPPWFPTPCANSDSNGGHGIAVEKGITRYYIAVSGEGIIDDPYFNLSINQASGCVRCIGDDAQSPTVTEFSISQRSSNRSLDDPLFEIGESVTICLDFEYDASESGSDGLHGIIPDFGLGWDLDAFDPMAVTLTPDSVTWHAPTDSLCAAYATEQLPILCTYFDSLSQTLKICNTFTDNCPCAAPIKRGAILPGGWFWNRDVNPDDMESCLPSKHYGLSSVVADIHFCFDMKVKESFPVDNFEAYSDLHVNFQTTSAGVTGCWNDPVAECKIDFAQKGPNWKIICEDTNTPNVMGDVNSEVCSNTAMDLELFVDSPDSFNIDVIAIPNPLITGAKNHYFVNKQGIINDTLVNLTNAVQVQKYVATSVVNKVDCKFYRDTFNVTVYPKLIVSLPITFCVDQTFDNINPNATNWISSDPTIASVTTAGRITAIKPGKVSFSYNFVGTSCLNTTLEKYVVANPIAKIVGDTSFCSGGSALLMATGGFVYAWTTGSTTAQVRFNVPTQAGVTVTDANGCSATATQIIIEVELPVVSITGSDQICIGFTTTLSPSTGGIWSGTNPTVGSVNNAGLVTGINPGTVNFIFTNTSTGCTSLATEKITVSDKTPAFFTGPSEICIGETTTVIPTTGGLWSSSNVTVATISNSGLVTGVGLGTAILIQQGPICDSKPITVKVKNTDCDPAAARSDLNIFSFVDNNGNGMYDANEDSRLPNCNVSVTDENFNGITNEMGNLVVRLDTGTYELRYEMPFGQWQTNLQVKNLTLDKAIEYDTVGFIPIIPSFVGKVGITPTWLRCNSTARLYTNCKNLGNKNSSGRFVVIIDEKTSSDYAVPLPDVQDAHRFEWEIKDLSPGQQFNSFIDINIPGVEFDSLRFLALLITLEGDTVSRFNYNGIIRCSYDPNDKRSWPDRIGEDNYTLRSERIDYSIRFQNNGNDTAFYVKIVDILDPKLDKKSLILNASSHEVDTYISGDTLIFEHINIILPDTATNFIESQGFVSFSFASLPDIEQGSIIFNKGEIIFDQNEPIITNTVKNTIVDALPCPLEAIWLQDQTIQVNAEGTVYEWYDCGTNALITTTSVPSFVPELTGSYYAVITGDFCKTVTECVTFITSSTSQTLVNSIRIFPNPNQGEFTISSQEAILNVLIRDNMGKQIQNYQYHNDADQRNISIYSLIPGMYVISIITKNNNHLEKVIVR